MTRILLVVMIGYQVIVQTIPTCEQLTSRDGLWLTLTKAKEFFPHSDQFTTDNAVSVSPAQQLRAAADKEDRRSDVSWRISKTMECGR